MDLLVGTDFLVKMKAKIDYDKCILNVNKQKIHLSICKCAYNAIVADDTVVPSRSIKLVRCQTRLPPNLTALIEPLESVNIPIACSLATVDSYRCIWVEAMNTSVEPVTLQKSNIIASISIGTDHPILAIEAVPTTANVDPIDWNTVDIGNYISDTEKAKGLEFLRRNESLFVTGKGYPGAIQQSVTLLVWSIISL